MKSLACAAAAALTLTASPAFAWGDLGHEVIAKIAYAHLTPAVRAKVDALLASDPDTLTAPDFASRSTWADRYRKEHPETASWHFVDIEITHPDLDGACFGHPHLAAGQAASAGPAQDCVTDKIREFTAELRDPSTPKAERILALKFLIHFIGDVHQPLHAADHMDKGGNCIALASSPNGHASNLHAFWDTAVVRALGGSADEIVAKLDAHRPSDIEIVGKGTPEAWARDSFQLAMRDAYALPDQPTCNEHRTVALSDGYIATAERDAAMQLKRAAIRLAFTLNRALG